LLDDAAARAQLGVRAAFAVRAHYAAEGMAARYEQVYDRLLT
jgi:hypothetical protein